MLAAVRHLFIFIKEDLCTMNVEARLWGLIYMNYLLFSDKHCIFFVHTPTATTVPSHEHGHEQFI